MESIEPFHSFPLYLEWSPHSWSCSWRPPWGLPLRPPLCGFLVLLLTQALPVAGGSFSAFWAQQNCPTPHISDCSSQSGPCLHQESHLIAPFYFSNSAFMRAKSLQLCPTFCDPVDCSPPGSSVHGIIQTRILEGAAISFSRGSSQPRVSNPYLFHPLHWQAGSLPTVPPGKPMDTLL